MNEIIELTNETPYLKTDRIIMSTINEILSWNGTESEYLTFIENKKIEIRDCIEKLKPNEISNVKHKLFILANIMHTTTKENYEYIINNYLK